ncbi:hypothetical protein ACFLW0_00240 [Chloroflexota bacterium]
MKDNDRKTEMSFSYLIACLYGDSKGLRETKKYHNLADAKKYFLKIIKSIGATIEKTITITDNQHKRELLDTIKNSESSIKSSKDFNSLDQKMISFQSELIFLLIGDMPRRALRQVPNRSTSWKLNGTRQIQYIQNSDHKKNIIFGAVQGKYKERFGSWGDFLYDVYHLQCHNDPDQLILWFKKNHTDIYYDLFDP